MRFKEYVQHINTILEEDPRTADYLVVASIDDEGNAFHPVHYAPSQGIYSGSDFDAYRPDDADDDSPRPSEPNAVCIN